MLACERVPLLAPSGSTIGLVTTSTALPLNGTTQIVAQVIEPAGTPPHSGTHVTFTTTLGSITPSEAETDSNGQATVLFRAGSQSGTATITAISGGSVVPSDKVLKILVGSAAVGKVVINASPAQVPSLGGSSTISAQVYDVNGNALAATPVSFSTTAGTLNSTLATTDGNGFAQVVLTTSVQAVVTASVGSAATSGGGTGGVTSGGTTPSATGTASASVTVGIAGSPTLVINPPATISAGLPAAFTFVVTPAATNPTPVKDVTVNWGDGSSQSLGAISGTSTQSHVFAKAQTYVINATITDASLNTLSVSTSVTAIPVALPTIIITPTVPTTHSATENVSFQIQITVPTGVNVENVTIDYGDNTGVQGLGSVTGTVTVTHVYSVPLGGATANVKVTVADSLNRSTQGQTSIVLP
jgi:hypothetical protein